MLHDHLKEKIAKRDEIEVSMLDILTYKLPPHQQVAIEGMLPLVMEELEVSWSCAWELICKASVYRAMWRRRQGLPRGW